MPEEKPTPEIETQTVSREAQSPSAQLRDKRVRPEGVVPKQAQGYVVAGLAVLILMAVMFSKNHARPAPKEAAPSPLVASTDVNQRKIQELEQDLSADQRQSQQQAAAQRADLSPLPANAATAMNPAQPGAAYPGMQLPPVTAQPTEPPRDPVADAEKALAFKARFASNLVSADDNAARLPVESADAPSDTAARSSSLPQPLAAQAAPASASTGSIRPPEVNVNSAHGQPYVVFEGTTIDTVLVNRLDGEFAGPLKVMVTNPIYSQDRQHLLIPEGTFILGDVQKVAGFGQKRLAVTFHRMLMPDGYSVDLDQFHGLDQAGATGLKDKVNNHYVEIFGASIALGVIAGAAEATNLNQGYNETGTEAYKTGIASSLSQSSANVLDRFINIPPTITIREGHRIKVYITQDMLLPAYENHTIPSDF
ncbi:MAG TPA: TrbI/VirB10 family protein [Acidobacteriaceae bacterium]|jgi:type IV secretion system protein VirB10|nr:TrbI/VirB10 family protein [Acidobacteriaceae bacterium]